MYTRPEFNVSAEVALELMKAHPFATLISIVDDAPMITHLPVLVKEGDPIRIEGHLAKGNPAWRHLDGATLIFTGPHAYITPTWYVSGRDVPTWNYAVVHARVRAHLVQEEGALVEMIKRFSDHFEATEHSPWEFSLPADLAAPGLLPRAIVGFEMEVEHLEAKFKLSQNRSVVDQRAVVEGLRARGDERMAMLIERTGPLSFG